MGKQESVGFWLSDTVALPDVGAGLDVGAGVKSKPVVGPMNGNGMVWAQVLVQVWVRL